MPGVLRHRRLTSRCRTPAAQPGHDSGGRLPNDGMMVDESRGTDIMAEWSHTPPPANAAGGVRLIRTPAAGTLRGVILSDQLIGTRTHYNGIRTLPCPGLDCEQCTKGVLWRWHGYIGVWLPKERERIVLELTASASQRLADHLATFGPLRGFDLAVSRPRGKANSRIVVTLGTTRQPTQLLPPDPDVVAVMDYVWGYSPTPHDMHPRRSAIAEPCHPAADPEGNGRELAARYYSPKEPPP